MFFDVERRVHDRADEVGPHESVGAADENPDDPASSGCTDRRRRTCETDRSFAEMLRPKRLERGWSTIAVPIAFVPAAVSLHSTPGSNPN